MNCPSCGFPCEDGARFCPSCGNQNMGENSDFVSLSPISETQPNMPAAEPSEQYFQMMEEKTESRFTGLMVFSICMAVLLIAAAIYLMTFIPQNRKEDTETEVVSNTETVTGLTGSWVCEDGYIVFTASGKFAADDLSGTYLRDDANIVLEGEKQKITAEYVLEDDSLTIETSDISGERSYTYYLVSRRTDLTYSELMEMWESIESDA